MCTLKYFMYRLKNLLYTKYLAIKKAKKQKETTKKNREKKKKAEANMKI